MEPSASEGPTYWDGEIAKARAGRSDSAWYRYMAEVYRRLLNAGDRDWEGPSLKTDLFEEARGIHAPLRHLPEPRFGIDSSPAVVAAARANMDAQGIACTLLVGDIRSLPFAQNSLKLVLSGSTLDHFEDEAEIGRALSEIGRVLKPGGRLVLTLDNPHNPLLWLRAHSPRLSGLRLQPYFIGRTLERQRAVAALTAAGFEVGAVSAVAHAPRDPAMRLARLAERRPDRLSEPRLARTMTAFEALQRAPTRWRTGYYLSFEATKRGNGNMAGASSLAQGEIERASKRRRGLAATVTRQKMRVVTTLYRRMFVMTRSLEAPLPPPAPSGAFTFAEMEEGTRSQYLALLPGRERLVEDRLQAGARCFFALEDGRIAHASWMAKDRVLIDYLAADMMLKPGHVYVYDAYSPPAYRGRGLGQAMGRHILRRAATEGHERAWCLPAIENAAGIRPVGAIGYELAGLYHFVRLGPYRRRWAERRSDLRLPELQTPEPHASGSASGVPSEDCRVKSKRAEGH